MQIERSNIAFSAKAKIHSKDKSKKLTVGPSTAKIIGEVNGNREKVKTQMIQATLRILGITMGEFEKMTTQQYVDAYKAFVDHEKLNKIPATRDSGLAAFFLMSFKDLADRKLLNVYGNIRMKKVLEVILPVHSEKLDQLSATLQK